MSTMYAEGRQITTSDLHQTKVQDIHRNVTSKDSVGSPGAFPLGEMSPYIECLVSRLKEFRVLEQSLHEGSRRLHACES